MSRVGFDLDGVVYDFRAAHAEFEVARGNAHCALDKAADHWDYFEGWGLTLDEWLTSYAEGVDAGHILWLGDPLPGAVQVSKRLKDAGHTIHIVTDRSIGNDPQGATRSWLESVGFQYDTLDFSRDKTVVPTDIFIEDRLQNADALNAAGTLCYLINQPWNMPVDGRPRVNTLDEFFDRVQDFARPSLPIGDEARPLSEVLAGDCPCGHPISNHGTRAGCAAHWLDETVAWVSCGCRLDKNAARVDAVLASGWLAAREAAAASKERERIAQAIERRCSMDANGYLAARIARGQR